MARMMKAFVMNGIGKVGFMEKPVPDDPGPNDAVIKTTRAWCARPMCTPSRVRSATGWI